MSRISELKIQEILYGTSAVEGPKEGAWSMYTDDIYESVLLTFSKTFHATGNAIIPGPSGGGGRVRFKGPVPLVVERERERAHMVVIVTIQTIFLLLLYIYIDHNTVIYVRIFLLF